MAQFLSGMVPTADEFNGLVTKVYECTSALTKNADTALEAVPGLTFAVETGYVYYCVALISYTGPAAADIQFDWDRTGSVASADIIRFIIGLASGTSTNADSNVTMPRREGDTDQVIGADGGTGSAATTYIEHLVITPSGDGTVQFRAAQAVSTASNTFVRTQSRLIVTRGIAG